MTLNKLRIVCATRESREAFFVKCALGRSLALTGAIHPNVELRLFPGNTLGLPVVYNTALQEARSDPTVLVFVHDDVYLCDYFWPNLILSGLATFDVIGIAGSAQRLPNQSAWNSGAEVGTWGDRQYLSGVLAQGASNPPRSLWAFGPPGREVKLLDGLLLAARSDVLQGHHVSFDPRFSFHFYDMDFCRQAEVQGLRMGTWFLSVIHVSMGEAQSPAWHLAYREYLAKWQS